MSRGSRRPPPVDTILVSVSPGEIRAAALRDGRAWDHLAVRAHRPDRAGTIYRARVRKVEPSMAAAFVDIGEGDAFLPLRGALHEGQAVTVQLVREAAAGKVAEVAMRLAFPGHRLVLTPGRPGVAASRRIADKAERQRLQAICKRLAAPGEGIIVRAAATGCEEEALAADLASLRAAFGAVGRAEAATAAPAVLWRDLPPLARWLRDEVPAGPKTVIVDDGALLSELRGHAAALGLDAVERHPGRDDPFEAHGIAEDVDAAAAGGPIGLPSGGRVWIERTRALTAVDVDTGGAVRHGRQADSLAAVNEEAAAEIARFVRLRADSGLLAVDFAGAPSGAEAETLQAILAAGFADDAAQVRILPPSPLGLLEMSRERLRPSLAETGGPEAVALAALRALVRQAPLRPALAVPPACAALLAGVLAPALADAERRLGGPVAVRAAADLAAGAFRVESA